MKKIIFLTIVLVALLLSGCADNEVVRGCLDGHTYGFWGGLWHGIIAPFDLIGMIIWDDVAFYAPNNNGGWYHHYLYSDYYDIKKMVQIKLAFTN